MQTSLATTMRRTAPDGRADDCSRRVTLAPEAILIERQVAGVKMRVCVPTSAYQALVVARRVAAAPDYAIVLTHRDPELCVVVDTAADIATLAERLPGWALFFGKPAERPGARRSAPIGRRRNRTMIAHRPRFLARRTCGRVVPTPTVFRHDDEIICYE